MSAPAPGVLAALHVLGEATEPLPAFVVGSQVAKANVANGGRGTGQRGPRYVSAGTIAAPALRSLSNRGWAQAVPRPEGFGGTAWVLTDAGRAAYAEHCPSE